MEKKLKAYQKLGIERIWRLFELAQKDEKRAKKYMQLAVKISEKTNCGLPREVKKNFCRKCYSIKIEKIEKEPFLIVKCQECGFEKKFPLKETRIPSKEKGNENK